MTKNDTGFIDTAEVARRAHCDVSNVRRLRLNGRMPAAKGRLGRAWVYDEDEIDEWLKTRPHQGQRPWKPKP